MNEKQTKVWFTHCTVGLSLGTVLENNIIIPSDNRTAKEKSVTGERERGKKEKKRVQGIESKSSTD